MIFARSEQPSARSQRDDHLQRSVKETMQRGVFVPSDLAEYVTATVHPSSILRAPTDEGRRTERARRGAALALAA